MPAPSWDHAVTIVNLLALLIPVIQFAGGSVTAPLDVFFKGADTVVIVVLLPESEACGHWRGLRRSKVLLIS